MRELTKREKEVGELRENNFSVSEIAEKLGITEYTVRQHYGNYKRKMKIPRKRELTERQKQAAELRHRGLTFREIGEELNISGSAAAQLYRGYVSFHRRQLKEMKDMEE